MPGLLFSQTRSVLDAAVHGFAGGLHTPEVMRQPHLHQEVELNLVPAGSITYLAGGKILRVPAGRLAVFWGAAPHQIIAVKDAPRFYWFTIPFAWVVQWNLPRGFLTALLAGQVLLDRETIGDDTALCRRWAKDLSHTGKERAQIAQLEMEARLRRLLLRRPLSLPPTQRGPVSRQVAAVQAMAEVIARRYAELLPVADIVRPTRLHPHYAMALFRSHCGMSILSYLLQHRLFHAQRQLLTTNKKVVDIAYESGFGSVSRFNEVFARANGCSPRRFRQTTPLPRAPQTRT